MKREITRTRTGGRKVYQVSTPEAIIQAFRDCVKDKAFVKINGCAVDTFSASAVVSVYDALNPTNQAKLLTFSIPGIVSACFRVLNKAKA